MIHSEHPVTVTRYMRSATCSAWRSREILTNCGMKLVIEHRPAAVPTTLIRSCSLIVPPDKPAQVLARAGSGSMSYWLDGGVSEAGAVSVVADWTLSVAWLVAAAALLAAVSAALAAELIALEAALAALPAASVAAWVATAALVLAWSTAACWSTEL